MVEFQDADDFFTTVAEGGGKAYRFTDIDGIGPATADKITSVRGVQNPEDVADMSADELSDKAGISHSRATKAIKGGGGNPNVSKESNTGSVSAAGITFPVGDFRVEAGDQDKARARNDTFTRSEEAIRQDDSKRAPITTDVEKWKDNKSKFDFPGVDTPTNEPNLLPKDVKRGDPNTADFDESGEAEFDKSDENEFPKKEPAASGKENFNLKTGPNRTIPASLFTAGGGETPDVDEFGVFAEAQDVSLSPGEAFEGVGAVGVAENDKYPNIPVQDRTARYDADPVEEQEELDEIAAEQSRSVQGEEPSGNSISLTLEEKAKPPLNPVTELPGVGPKTADRLQRKYGITTIRDYYQDEQVAREEVSKEYRAKARAVAADSAGVDIPGV